MKTPMLALLLVVILCTSCASVEQVELRQKEQWLPKAQKEVLNEDATVVLWDGRVLDGKVIRLDADSLCMVSEFKPYVKTVPLDRVNSIQPSRNVGAPIAGFLGGLIVGGAIGAAIGGSQEADPPNPYLLGFNSAMEKTVASASYGLIGAAIGSLALGTIVGAATAVTDYHISYNPPPKTARHSAPSLPDSARTGK